MTVTNETNLVSYLGNGATTEFDYEFFIPSGEEDDYFQVYLLTVATGDRTDLVKDVDYAITGVGAAEPGGTVTYPLSGSPLASTSRIVIERVVPFIQDLDIQATDGFNPRVVENQLDLMVMQIQQVAERQERTPQVPVGTSQADLNGLIGDVLRLVDSVDAIDRVAQSADAIDLVGPEIDAVVVAAALAEFIQAAPELASIAGLAIDEDQLPYGTGAAVYGKTAFTAYARELLAESNVAGARGVLELVPGTHVQAQDPTLQGIADDEAVIYGDGTSSSAATLRLRPRVGGNRTSIDFGDFLILQAIDPAGPKNLMFYHGPTNQFPLEIKTDGTLRTLHVYNGELEGSAYLPTPTPITIDYAYGQVTPSSGTAVGFRSNMQLHNIAAAVSGISEFTPIYSYLSVRADATQTPGQNYWGEDRNVQFPLSDSAGRPNFGTGISWRIMNLSEDGDGVDGSHVGVYGGVICVTPMSELELEQGVFAPDTSVTHPLAAGLVLCGYNGGIDVFDGYDANATPAGAFGLRIGGPGGHVYIPSLARSYWQVGIGVEDWDEVGIYITSRHPNGDGKPGFVNEYRSVLGGIGAETATETAVLIPYNRIGDSRNATLQFSDGANAYLMGTDPSGVGGNDWYLYSGEAGDFKMRVTPTGVAFNGAFPVAPPALPAENDPDLANEIRACLIATGLATA